MEQTSDARIILVTSTGAFMPGLPDTDVDFEAVRTSQDESPYGRWIRYGQSKLATILYGQALAKKKKHVTTVIVHPGVVDTNLVSSLSKEDQALVHQMNPLGPDKLLTPEKGAHNVVWASSTKEIESGQYYEPIGLIGQTSSFTRDADLATNLYDWTQKELERFL